MRSILAGFVGASLMTLAAPGGAAERCTFAAAGPAEVLVRYPIPHTDPHDPTEHTNEHEIWYISDNQATPGPVLGDEDPRIIAIGNFSSNGGCEALWEEREPTPQAVVKLAATDGFFPVATEAFLSGEQRPALPWDVASSFDLTGDGHADLLWWNSQTSAAALWRWSTNAGWIKHPVVTGLGPGWRPHAAARLVENELPGVIWSNPAANPPLLYQRMEWTGQALVVHSAATLEGLDSQVGWTTVAVGDFDSDGQEDLLRQNDVTQRLQVCFMQGREVGPRGCQALEPDGFEQPDLGPKWFVVGPR